MTSYYIGLDVHSKTTEIAIEKNKQILHRYTVPTSIPAISQVLDSLQGTKRLALEEGPMAGWLYRQLHTRLDQCIICDPRRNRLISSDGDKDDPLDAAKLAGLLRGNYLKPIYHSDNEPRCHLKQWVSLYYDRIRDSVRCINKIRARGRMYGVTIPRVILRNAPKRQVWLASVPPSALARQLHMLTLGLDATRQQARIARQQMCLAARPFPIIAQWQTLPGIGVIRAITLFAYLDTPWRFKTKSKLWKYCGVGLDRSTSGTDAQGRPKPARLRLVRAANRTLKNAVMGATISALNQKHNTFKTDYERMITHGIIPSNARHSVARKMLTILWGMWKQETRRA